MPTRAYDFNKYAAGNKIYGAGRSGPNTGMTLDKVGYAKRDAANKNKRNAALRKLKAQRTGNYMSPDWLRGSV